MHILLCWVFTLLDIAPCGVWWKCYVWSVASRMHAQTCTKGLQSNTEYALHKPFWNAHLHSWMETGLVFDCVEQPGVCPVCVYRRASCRHTQVSCGDTHKLSAFFWGSWPHCSALQTESLPHATHTSQGPHSAQNSLPVSHATISAALCFHIRDEPGSAAAAAEDRQLTAVYATARRGNASPPYQQPSARLRRPRGQLQL